MHDFSAREMTPGAVHFAGVANGGSFARLKPRTLAATAMKTAAAIGWDAMLLLPRSRGRASAVAANCRAGPASARRLAEAARWFPTEPASSSTARGRRGRTIVPNPLQRPMSKTV
jgi:hypothetical protein